MRNFEIVCSHEEIAMVLALAGGQDPRLGQRRLPRSVFQRDQKKNAGHWKGLPSWVCLPCVDLKNLKVEFGKGSCRFLLCTQVVFC